MYDTMTEGRGMLYTIQPESKVPIFQQIVDQVVFAIASGSDGAVRTGRRPNMVT